jgi:hypothetical protein
MKENQDDVTHFFVRQILVCSYSFPICLVDLLNIINETCLTHVDSTTDDSGNTHFLKTKLPEQIQRKQKQVRNMPKQYCKNQRGVTRTNTKADLVNSKKGQLKKISHYRKRCHVRYITPQKKCQEGQKTHICDN